MSTPEGLSQIERLRYERDTLASALRLCHAALADLTKPNTAVSGLGIQSAFAQCVAAEASARSALTRAANSERRV